MTVYIIKIVAKGNKNTRWQFADGYGNIFDGLLPTSGNYNVGMELDKDAFSSIRTIKSAASPLSTEVSMNSVDEVLAIRDAEAAMTNQYVDIVTGQTAQMTEAEFEAALEKEF